MFQSSFQLSQHLLYGLEDCLLNFLQIKKTKVKIEAEASKSGASSFNFLSRNDCFSLFSEFHEGEFLIKGEFLALIPLIMSRRDLVSYGQLLSYLIQYAPESHDFC